MLGETRRITVGSNSEKKWLKDRNNNSKFFHAIVNQRRNISLIESMRLDNGNNLLAISAEIHEDAV